MSCHIKTDSFGGGRVVHCSTQLHTAAQCEIDGELQAIWFLLSVCLMVRQFRPWCNALYRTRLG